MSKGLTASGCSLCTNQLVGGVLAKRFRSRATLVCMWSLYSENTLFNKVANSPTAKDTAGIQTHDVPLSYMYHVTVPNTPTRQKMSTRIS